MIGSRILLNRFCFSSHNIFLFFMCVCVCVVWTLTLVICGVCVTNGDVNHLYVFPPQIGLNRLTHLNFYFHQITIFIFASIEKVFPFYVLYVQFLVCSQFIIIRYSYIIIIEFTPKFNVLKKVSSFVWRMGRYR